MGLKGFLGCGFIPDNVEFSAQTADPQLLEKGRDAKLMSEYLPLI